MLIDVVSDAISDVTQHRRVCRDLCHVYHTYIRAQLMYQVHATVIQLTYDHIGPP